VIPNPLALFPVNCEPVVKALAAQSFHSLRHSVNSVLVNAGAPQELRIKLTGHSSADMNAIYSHHELATIRAAINHLPRILQLHFEAFRHGQKQRPIHVV